MNPKYPVYIISKGRWDSRLTSKALESMGVPYHIAVEPQEYDNYAAVIDPRKILVLPFSNLGQGSIPARNFCWDHAIEHTGAKRHWLMDDNIDGFGRFNNNLKIKVNSGTILRAAEDFVDRYTNVPLAGLQYDYFVIRKVGERIPPFIPNQRIYSCSLIENTSPYRWRGRYNEDTDMSLRILKDGLCTILFYAFIQYKTPTMQLKGGNTDELYRQDDQFDGRRAMAESLVEQHPDVTRVVWKFGRWHHHVDYRRFKYNKLIKVPGLEIPKGINNYGMELKTIDEEPDFVEVGDGRIVQINAK